MAPMRSRRRTRSVVLVTATLAAVVLAALSAAAAGVERQLLVRVDGDVDAASLAANHALALLKDVRVTKSLRVLLLESPSTASAAAVAADRLRGAAGVHFVEQNALFELHAGARHLLCADQCEAQGAPVSWGQVRTSTVKAVDVADSDYVHCSGGGTDVLVYVVDGGIYLGHNEFKNGRAIFGANFARDGDNGDGNGHGTHCAGTVAGVIYGISKKVVVVSVKVLNGTGHGDVSQWVEGLKWIHDDVIKRGSGTQLLSMSMGVIGGSETVDAAITALRDDAGVLSVVSAGNMRNDACEQSPARAPAAITVGATNWVDSIGGSDAFDERAWFSSIGTCVDVLAPGLNIRSAGIGEPDRYVLNSGTSMSAPHVAGALANVLSASSPRATPAQLREWLLSAATREAIDMRCDDEGVPKSVCEATPNRLLHLSCSQQQ